MAFRFAGFVVAEEFDVYRQHRQHDVVYTPNGLVQEVRVGPYVRFDCPLTQPDKLGAERYHANLKAHVAKYKASVPFMEDCPQDFNTLTGAPLSLQVNANTSQGATQIVLKGAAYTTVRSRLFKGRWVSFGTQGDLYLVESVGQGSTAQLTTLTLDIPLMNDVGVNSNVHLTPRVNWYWDQRMFESMPNTAGVWWRGYMFAIHGLQN